MMKLSGWLLVLAVAAGTAMGQDNLTAEEILAESMAYHDAEGLWGTHRYVLTLREERPDGRFRKTVLTLDEQAELFAVSVERDDHHIEASLRGDACAATLDGEATMPDSLRSAYRLSCDGLRWWRDYYGYLYSLPMKLKDPGTVLDPAVTKATYQGKEVLVLRVTYEEEVGGDTWYFYVDPATYALIGCRFYHDEQKNDGEYIVFEEEATGGAFRLPRMRSWYTNAEGRYLGRDIIESFEVLPTEGGSD